MQNITIIGGSGLLGRNLIKNLHKWNVTNLDKKPLHKSYQNENYQEILGDANDEKILETALKNADAVWIKAAKLAIKHGAHSITIHLREDRRHIRDKDLSDIKKIKGILINLEIAPTK